ncbi:double-stranded RNA-binding protein 2-like isoform X1 [Mangifera indica]|uniref:double-stranded RNA-binding protein 2-like isoform X1 n=1 Tax=Mangifera indica TaxID=29780 RepID=UPI001CF970CF|nr:double-stranded RNA-binding protein 2-like isoform X1 [Mangifera indica]
MYKNQLQELAQRSCFNLPSYSCIRQGPDHAPRFKATVNFNGEIFESPTFCSTLRQAEHAAAEVALSMLAKKGPSKALAARILDETGVYKNLLQETAHRAGLKLPVYTTVRSGPGHVPVFLCTVELAGMSFTGEPAKTKKQAQKNAALIAWSALKKLSGSASSSSSFSSSSLSESRTNDEQGQIIITRYLATLKQPETKNSQQRERFLGWGSAPIWRDVIPYGDTGSYSLQHQNWLCPQFSPELSLYQIYPQERASQQQDHLLAFSSLQISPPRPQFFPFIRSIFQPDHRHCFLEQAQEPVSLDPEIGPFLCSSNHVMPVPVRSVSQVTVQEIKENAQIEEEWAKGNGGSDCWKTNFPSNVPRLFHTEVPNSLVSFTSHSEQKKQMLQVRDEEKSSSSAPTARDSIQLQSNQKVQCNRFSPRLTDASFRPGAIIADGSSQKPDGIGYLQSNVGAPNTPTISSPASIKNFVPAPFAAPVMIRTSGVVSTSSLKPESSNPLMRGSPPVRIAASACSSRPCPEGMKNLGRMPSVNSMAPAVHIRSIVPVCSAPPNKKVPDPSTEQSFSGSKKRTKEPRGDTSVAT